MLTTEQKAARLGKITSSVAAGALGLSEYMTPVQAWLSVLGESPDIDTKATDRGNRLEDTVLDYAADELGLTRADAPFRRHPEHDWAGDSADATYYRGDKLVCVGEGKTASLGVGARYGKEGTDEIPYGTLIQSHWHLAHWPEARYCTVPVLVGGYAFEFRLYRVDRDPEFVGVMMDDLAQWHRDYVVTRSPPPLEAGDTDWIRQRHPLAKSGLMADTPELARLAEERSASAAQLKEAKSIDDSLKNQIRAVLGDHEGVKAQWGTITNRNCKASTKTDWEGLALIQKPPQNLIDQFTDTKPGHRTLRVNFKGA